MYERFVKLLQSKGITAYKLSQDTGISTATLSDWKKGRSTPKQDKLKKIADYFGVSLDYLTSGEEKERGGTYYLNDETAEMAQFLFENPDYKVLFDASRKVKPEDIKFVKEMIDRTTGDRER